MQARNQLGTPGGAKIFPRGTQIFSTMTNIFELCPTHFSRGGENFSRGGLAPWLRAWLYARWCQCDSAFCALQLTAMIKPSSYDLLYCCACLYPNTILVQAGCTRSTCASTRWLYWFHTKLPPTFYNKIARMTDGRQVIVFLFRRLWPYHWSQITTVVRGCWTPTRVCAVTTPLHSLYE